MAVRLGVASLGVAFLAYLLGPIPIMCVMVAVGVFIVWNHGTIPHNVCD